MNGRVRAVVEGRRIVLLETRPPVAAKILTTPAGPELVLVGAAAGLLEDDTVTIDLRLGPGARLTVRTTAATLAHPCPDGGWTETIVDATLGPGATLAWLPEPLVACAGCRHRSRSTIDLAPMVGADLRVMARDAAAQRGERPTVFTSLVADGGAGPVAAFIEGNL